MDRNLWHFLEKKNMNLLYKYTDVLVGNQSYIAWKSPVNRIENDIQASLISRIKMITTQETLTNSATNEQREGVYYLLWFVYRYVLECETLEQALEQDHIKVLQEMLLYRFIQDKYIYIGGEFLYIPLSRKKDIKIILEILYNRYSIIEQFECYLKHYGNINDKRTAICKEAVELYYNIRGTRFYDDTSNS